MSECCPLLVHSRTTAFLQGGWFWFWWVSLYISDCWWKKSCPRSTLTCAKLQLGVLSELAMSEGVTVSGCSPLRHRGPIDGSKHRHQYSHEGACKRKTQNCWFLTEPRSITVSDEITWQKRALLLMKWNSQQAQSHWQRFMSVTSLVMYPAGDQSVASSKLILSKDWCKNLDLNKQ